MSKYQRFLTYIYAYEEGMKGNNAGFAKVEIQGNDWRVEICLKGAPLYGTVTVFAVQPVKENVGLRQLGQLKMKGDGKFSYFGEYEEYGALLMKDETGNLCYSEWKSMSHELQRVTLSKKEETPKEISAEEEETETVEIESIESPETENDVAIKRKWSPLWKLLQKVCPKRLPAPGFEAWELLEIRLEDIGRLSRENWVYGNNSFLVQGYYRYRYLLLAAKETECGVRYCLCVPGIKNETEEMVAGLFGFQEFMPGGRRQNPPFGYWCVDILMSDD